MKNIKLSIVIVIEISGQTNKAFTEASRISEQNYKTKISQKCISEKESRCERKQKNIVRKTCLFAIFMHIAVVVVVIVHFAKDIFKFEGFFPFFCIYALYYYCVLSSRVIWSSKTLYPALFRNIWAKNVSFCCSFHSISMNIPIHLPFWALYLKQKYFQFISSEFCRYFLWMLEFFLGNWIGYEWIFIWFYFNFGCLLLNRVFR